MNERCVRSLGLLGQHAGSDCVHRLGGFDLSLRAVDVSVRCGVDNHARTNIAHGAPYFCDVGQVERDRGRRHRDLTTRTRDRNHIPQRDQRALQFAADLTARADEQNGALHA
ncbi:MAG TPA: hypothetical protein VGJ26_01445, partial [Pirellulales bacterium]